MKSINYQLRSVYMTALSGMVVNTFAIPVYYLTAPESETGKNYITLNSVGNTDESTFNSADTNTSMQVQIHTWDYSGNAGKMADDIANEVYQRIYPNSQAVLTLSGSQMVQTKMQNDLVQEISDNGNRFFVQRIITFLHNILH